MSARVDEILEVVQKVRANFPGLTGNRSVRDLCIEAANQVAAERGILYGTVTNKFRRELEPAGIVGVKAFYNLLETWLIDGSDELRSVMVTRAPSERGRINDIFIVPGTDRSAEQGGTAEGGSHRDDPVDAALELGYGITSQGQRFLKSLAVRKEIERIAMERAESYYSLNGWEVDDVSRSQSYDLLCRREGQELHVEVKGTMSAGHKILLTRNEVEHAKAQPQLCALFILANVRIDHQDLASGGDAMVIDSWQIHQGRLNALTYEYLVPQPRTDTSHLAPHT